MSLIKNHCDFLPTYWNEDALVTDLGKKLKLILMLKSF